MADSSGGADDKQLRVAVDAAVDEALDDAVDEVEAAADTAERAEAGALDAEAGAEQARDQAVDASLAAAEAAGLVEPDDPLLDTEVRKIAANASEENPYGVPGRPMSKRSPFRLAFSAALGVALAYGLVKALISVRSVLILILISAFLAIGLNPVVEALERRGFKRGRAVGGVFVAVLLFFAAFAYAVVPPIIDQASDFVDAAPGYLDDLRENTRVAALNEQYGFIDRAKALLDEPGTLGTTALGGVVGVGKVVFSAFFSTLTVLILTLYFLSSLPTIKAAAYRMIPRSRRARVGLLTDEILGRVGGYVGGALTIAATAGVTTFVLLAILGVDYPVALAMIVAVTSLVPLVGATIGAAIVVLVAFFTSVTAGVICAIFYLIYQQVENYVLYPKIMQRSVDVSPAATVVAVLIGGSLLGVLGALLAIPLAAAVQLVLQEVVAPRQENS